MPASFFLPWMMASAPAPLYSSGCFCGRGVWVDAQQIENHDELRPYSRQLKPTFVSNEWGSPQSA